MTTFDLFTIATAIVCTALIGYEFYIYDWDLEKVFFKEDE